MRLEKNILAQCTMDSNIAQLSKVHLMNLTSIIHIDNWDRQVKGEECHIIESIIGHEWKMKHRHIKMRE